MNYRAGLAALLSVLAITVAACASTEDDAPISQREGRSAAAGVPPSSGSSATVRGGLSTPAGF